MDEVARGARHLWTVAADPALDFNSAVVASLDRDTLAAITGGVVACAVGLDGIPLLWREATEAFHQQIA